MLSLYEILKTSKTKVAPDLWTRLAAKKMAGDSEKVRELTGELPLTFTANGKPLIDYTIYGNMTQTKECGERTRNLFDKDASAESGTVIMPNTVIYTDHKIGSSNGSYTAYLPCEPNTTYRITKIKSARLRCGTTSDVPAKGVALDDYVQAVDGNATTATINTSENAKYICFFYYNSSYDTLSESEIRASIQVEEGSSATLYEPYGYKIPISVNGQTNNIYIGSEPLRKAVDGSEAVDTLNYSTQQLIRRVDSSGNALAEPITENIELPELSSNNGTTIIDAETTLKPSKMYIKYKE